VSGVRCHAGAQSLRCRNIAVGLVIVPEFELIDGRLDDRRDFDVLRKPRLASDTSVGVVIAIFVFIAHRFSSRPKRVDRQ
jgi:hypothetical protein